MDCYHGLCQKLRSSSYSYNFKSSHLTLFNYFNDIINTNNSESNEGRDIKIFYEEDDEEHRYINDFNYECAKECAINKGKYCSSCPSSYIDNEGKCLYVSNDPSYNIKKFCFANNLILKWKNFLYTKQNVTSTDKYTYLNSAILPNEDCPSDKQLCGTLDEYGNKLCLPKFEYCPINKVVISNTIPSDGYNYQHIILNDLSLYYTNEAKKNGTILTADFLLIMII